MTAEVLRPVGTARPGLLDAPVHFPATGFGDPGPAEALGAHLATYPVTEGVDADDLVDRLAGARLTGRGGAHFPVAVKWRAVLSAARARGQVPVVVGNAAEGEPASAKDAALLGTRPHLVLDGLVLAARAVGATEALLWVHRDASELRRRVEAALAERRAAGLADVPVRLVPAPPGYLSGESSAVVRGLSGGPALPEVRRRPAAVDGVDGRPTLLNNAETLARVGLVARPGAQAYPQTSLVTVVTEHGRTVLEVDQGTRLGEAVRLGGWTGRTAPQAVLLGGYGGSWLPWARAAGLGLHEPDLRDQGVSMGAGVLAVLPAGACGIAETARLAEYLTASGARQCGPCQFGLPAITGVLSGLREGTARRADIRRLQGWAAEVSGRGACHHPDGAVRMVLSALVAFAADVEAHRRGRPCAAAGARPLLPVPGVRT